MADFGQNDEKRSSEKLDMEGVKRRRLDSEDDITRQKKGLIGFDGKDNEWCPYTETSKNYDLTRRPLGVSITLGAMANSPWKLAEQELLDVGCGTGTFINVVKGRFGKITGVEYNIGMIDEAKKYFGSDKSIVVMQGSADKMDFVKDTFHSACMNQVTHHFPNADNFIFLKGVCGEIFRVLKPGGCLVINHATPEQERDGYWWGSLLTKAEVQVMGNSCPMPLFLKYLREVGFSVEDAEIATPLMGTLMSEDTYLKKHGLEGAFVKEYRDGDSTWAAAEKLKELKGAQDKIREMQKNGTADKWLADREELRKRTGQASFIVARKPV